jgi:acetyltransferase-like isoleucine patch superfamily enzyme
MKYGGRFKYFYLKICKPSTKEYADYLRIHGGLKYIGKNVKINLGATFTDPSYVSISDNVVLADCCFIGHDGSVEMLYHAYGESVDAVGKIIVHENVFIGHGAIVLRGVSIGPNAIVAAGAVVSRDVPEGSIFGGIPAKPIGRVEDYLRKLSKETDGLPWGELIRARKGGFDAAMEPELLRMRMNYFFPDEKRQ